MTREAVVNDLFDEVAKGATRVDNAAWARFGEAWAQGDMPDDEWEKMCNEVGASPAEGLSKPAFVKVAEEWPDEILTLVLSALTDCFDDLHVMIESPQVTTSPDWDCVADPAYPASLHPLRSSSLPVAVMVIPWDLLEIRNLKIFFASSNDHADTLEQLEANRLV